MSDPLGDLDALKRLSDDMERTLRHWKKGHDDFGSIWAEFGRILALLIVRASDGRGDQPVEQRLYRLPASGRTFCLPRYEAEMKLFLGWDGDRQRSVPNESIVFAAHVLANAGALVTAVKGDASGAGRMLRRWADLLLLGDAGWPGLGTKESRLVLDLIQEPGIARLSGVEPED